MMVVVKVVHVIVILICLLTRAIDSAADCLTTIEAQLKDPNRMFQQARVRYWSEDRVSSIDLGGFGLEGEFPSGVKECSSSLTSLNLSGNHLSGPLPYDLFAFLPYLVTLDLSYNSFSGEIPVSWSNLAYLNVLLLDYNQLTGRIPLGLASCPRLKQFSFAYNYLTGPIPEFNDENVSIESFDGNPDLCGFPLDPCLDPFSLGSIIAAVIGAVIFFPLGAAIGWFCVDALATNRPRSRKKQHPGRNRTRNALTS